MHTSLLSTLVTEWQDQGWPLADLAAFRMEGEGAGGEGAGGEGQGNEAGDGAAEVEKWKAQSRKHEDRAKANAAAVKERDDLKKQLEELEAKSLSDGEKAIKEADKAGFERGKAEAAAELTAKFGGQLVAAEVKAAAAGRLDADQLTTLVEGLNVAAFLADTGEVDTDKVTKWVDGIAPKAEEDAGGRNGPPVFDLGQGARGGQNKESLNGDPLVGALKSKLGMR